MTTAERRPLLSLLIPTRNRAQYLRYAIQSALNLDADDVEILVSENHGSDDGHEVARSFVDPRLHVLRPERPLPMHEHFEWLLGRATGEWITFIGDDDAVMPHCSHYLDIITQKHPWAEAIVTPRADYFWESLRSFGSPAQCFVRFEHHEAVRDSKKSLARCLDNRTTYFFLPQLYSGGFQRRTLVNRVRRLQGGRYFSSVMPDSYSAVMGVLHTYRYLEVGVPVTWVGSSPKTNYGGQINLAKDREKELFGMHTEDVLTLHRGICTTEDAKGEDPILPMLFWFFEAYVSAAPFTALSDFSMSTVSRIYRSCATELILGGHDARAAHLARFLGMEPLDPQAVRAANRRHAAFRKMLRLPGHVARKLGSIATRRPLAGGGDGRRFPFSHAAAGSECADILATDDLLRRVYADYCRTYLIG